METKLCNKNNKFLCDILLSIFLPYSKCAHEKFKNSKIPTSKKLFVCVVRLIEQYKIPWLITQYHSLRSSIKSFLLTQVQWPFIPDFFAFLHALHAYCFHAIFIVLPNTIHGHELCGTIRRKHYNRLGWFKKIWLRHLRMIIVLNSRNNDKRDVRIRCWLSLCVWHVLNA